MSVVLGFLRHICEGEQRSNPLEILGQVDRLGEGVFWGVEIPGGPPVYNFAWKFCPHCAEQFPLKIADWDTSAGKLRVGKSMGFRTNDTVG